MVWTAPAPLVPPGLPPAPPEPVACWNRGDTVTPRLRNITDYNNPCSGLSNNHGAALNPDDFGAPSVVGGLPPWARPACQGVGHVASRTVCHYCQTNIQKQGWLQSAKTRIKSKPPKKQINAWAGFLTRMCGLCEIREQLLLNSRTPGEGQIVAPIHLSPAMQNDCVNYPTNTCTCLPMLTNDVHCIRHREVRWEKMQPVAGLAVPLPRQRVAIRNQNEQFLRNLANSRPPGQVVLSTASPALVTFRKTHRRYRACRCGDEVVTVAKMRIVQCMGCEGIVHLDPSNPVPTPTGWGPGSPAYAFNSSNHMGTFTMMRPQNAALVAPP